MAGEKDLEKYLRAVSDEKDDKKQLVDEIRALRKKLAEVTAERDGLRRTAAALAAALADYLSQQE